MATELQKQALNIKIQKIKEKKPIIMGRIMREAGYSKKASEYPKRLTESTGWKYLMDKHLPDERLAEIHSELLNSKDQRVKMEALKEGYKIKDKLPKQDSKLVGLFQSINDIKE